MSPTRAAQVRLLLVGLILGLLLLLGVVLRQPPPTSPAQDSLGSAITRLATPVEEEQGRAAPHPAASIESSGERSEAAVAPEPSAARIALHRARPSPGQELWIAVRLRRGSTLGELLREWGMPVASVLRAASPHYDLAHVRPDRELSLHFSEGRPEPTGLRYEMDEDRSLVVQREEGGWEAALEEVQYHAALGSRELVLRRSLWADGLDAGLRPSDLVRLAQIFEYEIDFNTELKEGARLSLVAEILSAEGRRDRIGSLHAIRLENDGERITAVRLELPSGEEAYFHPDGSGMKRPFLRSPLEFSRVTSGFNLKRYHPILKTRRPHYGTDYGAPRGTPVRAVADGVVKRAGLNGGHGNYVEIRHDARYRTSYSHLSRIGVRAGERVRQGEVIGKVGATGLATGPHLHYQMWRDGSFVDPMRVELPRTASVPTAQQEAFSREVARWLPLLPATPGSEASTPSSD